MPSRRTLVGAAVAVVLLGAVVVLLVRAPVPAVSGPSAAGVAHSASLSFSGGNLISMSDVDAAATEKMTLSVTSGTLNVTLTSGMKRAVGFGRLNGSSGSGTWRAAMCSGTWTAQRI